MSKIKRITPLPEGIDTVVLVDTIEKDNPMVEVTVHNARQALIHPSKRWMKLEDWQRMQDNNPKNKPKNESKNNIEDNK